MADSFDARRPVPGASSDTFADGMAVRVAIPYAVDVLNEVATHMLRVSERELARAVGAFADAGIRVEGSGAAGLAALPQLPAGMDKPSAYPFPSGAIVLVVTGKNIDEELHQRARNQPQAFPA
jgi:threonine dehydratase